MSTNTLNTTAPSPAATKVDRRPSPRRQTRAPKNGHPDAAEEFDSAFVRPASSSDDDVLAVPDADVVIEGRNVEIPEHFRLHVGDRLAKLEKFDTTLYRFSVVLLHERNRRQAKVCQRVEITGYGKGTLVRGEACAENFYAALENAVAKVQSGLRKTKDRRKVHHGLRTPTSLAEATAAVPTDGGGTQEYVDKWADSVSEHEPGRIVRVKDHPAVPMTVDAALYQMELVGHDFFLFHDIETDIASVVYRRHAYDYGLIRLAPTE